MDIYILNTVITGKLLSELLCKGLTIKGLITLDDCGSGKPNEYYDYSEFCEKNFLECLKVSSYSLKNKNDINMLKSINIDLLIIAGWQRLIPEWFINHCTIGVIGNHGSHVGIENGRGRSPQNWALLSGKAEFSISIFWITPEIDSGQVIDTRVFKYTNTDTILSSHIKVDICVADMIIQNIDNGLTSEKGVPQKEGGEYLPQRVREDGKIDWNRNAIDIYNFIRAISSPYPGAYSEYKGREYIIDIARPIDIQQGDLFGFCRNGEVISVLDKSFLVKCGEGILQVDKCSRNDIFEGMIFESADYKRQIKAIVERHMEKYSTQISKLVYDELN
ncbi:hypothetical protein FMM80_05265 [Schaedlerella arabinosiphila]|uniref:Formyl transferase N-terminal domain-containing protein n=1 Tax=Schaedlerella arabinosiphila TaxID=2044587 RepID=A0A9X5C5S2_9FIRM|nr:formyltransferase family protein [Schaedlerella arabinosiphila]KAI4443543.1 Methionyl-tRNA formyltransferase [Schaedlerella arabinosiphila]NDO68150.1 hypothetical protein [Schaedlerella arabinosiphila]